MSALLQEIVSVYPLLAPASLTAGASNRVCNALALLQCVASHNDTRALFLQAHIPLFLYPFLNTTSKTRPFEYLRLTSLGVIGALVKQNDNSDVINFLLSTEIIPLCLRIMETGSELSKTVAIFIVQKILLDEMGLAYICQTYERFYAVGTVLSNMVTQLVETQAVRLLKHVVRCYLRLSDNLRWGYHYVTRITTPTTDIPACSTFAVVVSQSPRGAPSLPPRTVTRRHLLALAERRPRDKAVSGESSARPERPRGWMSQGRTAKNEKRRRTVPLGLTIRERRRPSSRTKTSSLTRWMRLVTVKPYYAYHASALDVRCCQL